jgi:hypothetical protein
MDRLRFQSDFFAVLTMVSLLFMAKSLWLWPLINWTFCFSSNTHFTKFSSSSIKSLMRCGDWWMLAPPQYTKWSVGQVSLCFFWEEKEWRS